MSTESSGEESAERGEEKLFQVAFDLPEETAAWAPGGSEQMWVAKTAVKLQVEVRNIPFYVKGIAYADIVRVRVDHDRQELVFDEFVEESGHSTIRVILRDENAEETLSSLFARHDCSWEVDATNILWAVDISPAVDYGNLQQQLLVLRGEGKIDLQESALSRAHKASVSG